MKPNKSPGIDGLTSEFYNYFWNDIGNLLTNAANESYGKGELSATQNHSVLSLLYKKGDPTKLENWRPISLLCVDYKIIARALATRLQKVIHKIVSEDQQGYIQNRFIGYNLRLIQDIIDYSDTEQLDGAILFLDFKNAFEWEFLFLTLRHFGFKSGFINWIKTLYSNISSSIFNNGYSSDTFNLSWGY